MTDLIPAMEKALIVFSAGKVTQPVRSVIKVDPPGGFLGLMPALTPEGLGLKAVTFYPSNAERGIPTHMATIFLVDPRDRHATRNHGRKVDYRDAHGCSLSGRDETSRGARRKNSRVFSEAVCKRAVTSKRCDLLGNSKKFAFGVRRGNTQSNSPKKLVEWRCLLKKQCAARTLWSQ